MEFAIASKKVLMEKRLPRYLTSLPQHTGLQAIGLHRTPYTIKVKVRQGQSPQIRKNLFFPTKLNELRVPFRTAR